VEKMLGYSLLVEKMLGYSNSAEVRNRMTQLAESIVAEPDPLESA
jgi:hypothetical protein